MAVNGKHARIYSRIWHNPDFLALTSGAQRVYMLALSQDTLTLCGVTTYTDKRWSRLASNTTPKAIRKDIEELAGAGFVITDDDTEELCIRSYLKWDGVLDSPNMIIGMASSFETVHSGRIRSHIIERFHQDYPKGFRRHLMEGFPKGFPKGLPEGFLEVLGEGFREVAHAGSHAPGHARTDSDSDSDSTSPEPFPPPDTEEPSGDVVLRTATGTKPEAPALAHRLADICTGEHRSTVTIEAINVVLWALDYVDARIVDEAIGWAQTKPPTLPRAVAPVIVAKGADRGIRVPEYTSPLGISA